MIRRIAALAALVLLMTSGGIAFAQDHGLDGPGAGDVASEPRGLLGMDVIDITPELRAHFGAPPEIGVLVGRVEPRSRASAAGIAVGDVLTRVGEAGVSSTSSLLSSIRSHPPRTRVVVEVVRAKRVWRLSLLVPDRQPAPPAPRDKSRSRYRWPSDLLDPWTNAPIPPDPWDPRFEDHLDQRVRELERRMREMERRMKRR